MKKLPLYIFRLILILAAVGLFWFLFNKHFAPSGVLEISKTVDGRSPFLSRVLPDDRSEELYLDESGLSLKPIVAEPVYFTLDPPRDFDRVDFEIVFKNDDAPIVELGALVNVDSEQYRLRPLQNKLLDDLDWVTKQEGGLVLYDRDGKYDSIADFLVNPPHLNEVAAYHYPFYRDFNLRGYSPSSAQRVLDVSLRGEHEFLTYIENEELNFKFEYMDMNRTLGEDSVTILVFDRNDNLVASKRSEDDGDDSDSGRGSFRSTIQIRAQVPNGVYKVIMKVNRDIFFRTISTTQQKITFLNQLFIGDEVGYQSSPRSASFITDAKGLTFETQHAEGVQDLIIGKKVVPVGEPFVQTRYRVKDSGLVSVTVPVGDMLVRGAGHFAFSESMYFNPDPLRLEWDTDLDALGVNYVIATYIPPIRDGDLIRARVSFDTTELPLVRDAWKFAISLPGIYDYEGQIELHKIRATLNRPRMTFGEFLKKIWN